MSHQDAANIREKNMYIANLVVYEDIQSIIINKRTVSVSFCDKICLKMTFYLGAYSKRYIVLNETPL